MSASAGGADLGSQSRPLRQRETVRFHTGTSEVLGEVVLLDTKALGDTLLELGRGVFVGQDRHPLFGPVGVAQHRVTLAVFVDHQHDR